MSASKIFHFPLLIIFKQIVQLWTCQYKHIVILLCVFVTDNNVNSKHEMSTAKSLCYMAPPAPVSKCQPRKWLKNVKKNGEKCPWKKMVKNVREKKMSVKKKWWKMVINVRPSHPHHDSADHDIQQILSILVTDFVNFLGSYSNLKFYECTLTSVRTAFIINLQSTIFKDRIDILLSHYPE